VAEGPAARVLSGALVLALALGCSLRRDPPPGATGAEIYVYQNCANCHGENGEGRSQGPALAGLASSWELDALVGFLADPDPFVERDPRLAALLEEHSGEMSSYANLTREERTVLAAWLLATY
jgi:mono/diheme cytochrome c family protein